jgi:three-Cys-motif partner protein
MKVPSGKGSMMPQRYGGPWSEVKLDAVMYYLSAYTVALRSQGFELWYFDGFAGTGNREADELRGGILSGQPIEQVVVTLDGSARRALRLTPGFHGHLFVERDAERHAELLAVKAEFPGSAIRCVRGDANLTLKIVANWIVKDRNRRGVAFLDPFSTQVDFVTLQSLAATKQIDVWYLFNIGAVARLLANRMSIADVNRVTLDRMLSSRWRELYELPAPSGQADIFDGEDAVYALPHTNDAIRTVTRPQILDWFRRILSDEFAYVSEPLPLITGKAGNTLSLFLAIGNDRPAAVNLARKLASDTIKKYAMKSASHRMSGR